jgi:hypothetical protein
MIQSRMLTVCRRTRRGRSEREEQEQSEHYSETEEECVSLEVADLDEAEEVARSGSDAGEAFDGNSIDDGPVEKGADGSDPSLHVPDEGVVEFIEIELVGYRSEAERFGFAFAVEEQREPNST